MFHISKCSALAASLGGKTLMAHDVSQRPLRVNKTALVNAFIGLYRNGFGVYILCLV
jgi:hypothetical protein